MKTCRLFILAAFLGLIFILAFPYIGPEHPEGEYTESIISEYKEDIFFRYSITRFPIRVEAMNTDELVTNDSVKIGVAGQVNEMHFGRIPIGASTTKILEINNNEKTWAKAFAEIKGPMNSFTVGIDTEKMLAPGEKSEIKIKCEPTKSGNYTGEAVMTIISPKSGFFEQLLRLM